MPQCVWFHLRGSSLIPIELWIKRIVPQKELLSNKYRISWIIAKLEQVFYRLVAHIFFPLPGDVLELEGEKQTCVTVGDYKRHYVPETDQVGNCFQGVGIDWEHVHCSKPTFLYFSGPGTLHSCEFFFIAEGPKAIDKYDIILLQDLGREQ